jgi:small subunit ribosomal protein S16
MAVKLRLSRKGRKKAPFYHIVVADARSPRDGKFIEKIGSYNPMTKPATIEIDRNAAYDWLTKGAQPTDTVKAILRFKGVYYKKHLMRGVKKGALTLEQVDTMWQQWIDAKEAKITARRTDTMAEMEAFRKMVSGEAKAKVVVADQSTKEAAEAFKVESESHADTAPVAEVAETVVEEVAIVEEVAVAEEIAEVAVVAEEAVVEPVAEVADADTVVETVAEVVEPVAEEASADESAPAEETEA